MAQLSTFTRDRSVVEKGERIAVGPADAPFFVTTRGFSPAYRDALHKLRMQATREANRTLQPGQVPVTPDTLPPSVDDRCQAQALISHCLQDVDGLDDGAEPVSFDAFCNMLPESPALLALSIAAAARVGDTRAEQIKAAEGN